MPDAAASSSARASRPTTRSSSGCPSDPRTVPSGSTSSFEPTFGPSMTVARATGRSARSASANRWNVPRHQSSSSMYRWIVPPHVRPTANASSSENPNVTTPARRSPARIAECLADDGTFDASAAHAAGNLAGLGHRHRRTRAAADPTPRRRRPVPRRSAGRPGATGRCRRAVHAFGMSLRSFAVSLGRWLVTVRRSLGRVRPSPRSNGPPRNGQHTAGRPPFPVRVARTPG